MLWWFMRKSEQRAIEKIAGRRLPDGRVEATVTKGTMAGAKALFICMPPEAAYFNHS